MYTVLLCKSSCACQLIIINENDDGDDDDDDRTPPLKGAWSWLGDHLPLTRLKLPPSILCTGGLYLSDSLRITNYTLKYSLSSFASRSKIFPAS